MSTTIRRDAYAFASYGGWVLDTQFTHLVGQSMLLAAGTGRPVSDASTEVSIAQDADYRVWVHQRDWYPEHSPGKFRLLIDGEAVGPVLGVADHDEWHWREIPSVRLTEGVHTLSVRDVSGYYGRFTGVVLSSDPGFAPPDRRGPAAAPSASPTTPLTPTPPVVGDFDLAVVGGGIAGVCSAVTAARLGMRVALLTDRPRLGGNASDEAGVSLDGAASHHANARESGLVEELFRDRAYHREENYTGACERMVAREATITVLKNERVVAVERLPSGDVSAVHLMDTINGDRTAVASRFFVDATGDGTVAALAGAEFHYGRESQSEYGESLAPAQSDDITMSGCIMDGVVGFRSEERDRVIAYEAPPWAPIFHDPDRFGRSVGRLDRGAWWMEHAGTVDDMVDAERARDELMRISYGYWDYVKNRWPGRDAAARRELVSVPYYNARREGRRVIGDYVLTQQDLQDPQPLHDAVAHGGWSIDIHNRKGIYSGKEGPFEFNDIAKLYAIPYRCLYAKDIGNLFLAGRCISVSHVALGSVRVQATLAVAAEAVGVAAAIAASADTDARGVLTHHLDRLQQTLLRLDHYIPSVVDSDPANLARGASVCASTTATTEVHRAEDMHRNFVFPLSNRWTLTLREQPGTALRKLSLLVRSTRDDETVLRVVSGRVTDPGEIGADAARTDPIQVPVPPHHDGWIAVDIPQDAGSPASEVSGGDTGTPRLVYLTVEKAEGISVYGMDEAPLHVHAGTAAEEGWTDHARFLPAFATTPDYEYPRDFSPSNVVNGVARPVGEDSNQWASDPEATFPQWIEVSLTEAADISRVAVTFDTNLNTPRYGYMQPEPRPRRCVRDYDVQVRMPPDGVSPSQDAPQWCTVAWGRDNYLRHRVHDFRAVRTDAVRVVVHRTHGDRSARIFEIRAYGATQQ